MKPRAAQRKRIPTHKFGLEKRSAATGNSRGSYAKDKASERSEKRKDNESAEGE
jgi:hypothetical protein